MLRENEILQIVLISFRKYVDTVWMLRSDAKGGNIAYLRQRGRLSKGSALNPYRNQ